MVVSCPDLTLMGSGHETMLCVYCMVKLLVDISTIFPQAIYYLQVWYQI